MASLRLALKASIKEANLPDAQVQLSVPDLDALNQRKQKRNRAPSSPTSKSEAKRKRSMSEMSTDSAPVVKKTSRPKKAPKQTEEKSEGNQLIFHLCL